MNIEHLFTNHPYLLKAEKKQKLLANLLWKLSLQHKNHCPPYQRILEALPVSSSPTDRIEDLPMLPVRLFKTREFRSVPQGSVIRILQSSGTASQIPAHIYIDKRTLELAAKAFLSVIGSAVEKKRFPVILVDTTSPIQDENTINIRNYTLQAWKHCSSDFLLLLDEAMNIKWKELDAFLKKTGGERLVLFGFTFIIWQHLYQPLVKRKLRLNLTDGILFHAGGWKKIKEHAKDSKAFKRNLTKQLGLKKIYNFYGMTELIGIAFLECERGHLHTPDFADIVIRDPDSLKSLPKGRQGLIQVFSPLARSFPGHSLLTEDLGEVLGEDDCPCGRNGKYFRVYGRMSWAEIRGCSNTYAYQFYGRSNSKKECL
ncbi:acyl-protein synthetase [Candidatus Omnitrophota bacterium]